MAWLDDVTYVVCDWSNTILTYSTATFSPLNVIKVDGLRRPTDIVACRDDRRLYIGDCESPVCVWRVSAVDHGHEIWLPTSSTTEPFYVTNLSLRCRRLLLLKSTYPRGLLQFDADRRQRVIRLPTYMTDLNHAIQTARQTFIVAYRQAPQQRWVVSKLVYFYYRTMLVYNLLYFGCIWTITARQLRYDTELDFDVYSIFYNFSNFR